MQFRTGVRLLVRVPVASATIIEPGDLVYLDSGEAAPAWDFPWTTDLATTRAAFAAAFLGVAYGGSDEGQTDDVSVDISAMSFYEAESLLPITDIGALVGPVEEAGALSNRVLEETPAAEAIGRVMKTSEGTATRLGASFASAISAGSANVNAAVG